MFFKRVVNHKRKQNSNGNGFTLIEVLIAMVIFSIGILGVAKMQNSAIIGNAHARKITDAATLGQDIVERIIALDYDDVKLDDDDPVGDLTKGLGSADEVWQHKEDDPDSPYDVYSKIVENYPITENKTIRTYVEWKAYGKDKNIFIDYMKVKTN